MKTATTIHPGEADVLRQLSSRTERAHVESQGRIRGKVVWPATLKSRYTGEYDPTRFVCREMRRRFDTPENQLLRYLIEAIWHAIAMVPATIRADGEGLPWLRLAVTIVRAD